MVNVQISTLNVYFRYHDKTTAGNDTIVEGMQRLGATEEVIQNTRVENRIRNPCFRRATRTLT